MSVLVSRKAENLTTIDLCMADSTIENHKSPDIAVAATEADEVIASSVFVQIMGIAPQNAAGQGHFDHLWSLRLVWF